MDKKILVLLLLGVSLLAFGCAGNKKAQEIAPHSPSEIGPSINDTANHTAGTDSTTGGASGWDVQGDTDTGPTAQDVEDEGDNETAAQDVEDDTPEVDPSIYEGKNITELADLFKVDTDKPLEDEGFDVKSPESNGS